MINKVKKNFFKCIYIPCSLTFLECNCHLHLPISLGNETLSSQKTHLCRLFLIENPICLAEILHPDD